MTVLAPIRKRWIVSADIGQSIDPTAIAVLEATTRRDAQRTYYSYTDETRPEGLIVPSKEWFGKDGNLKYPNNLERLDVRHLERLPLRTSYPDQVAYITALLRRPPLNGTAAFCLDQTGVGRAVVDMFRRGGLRPVGVTITAGEAETRTPEGDYRVAKLQLVSGLQADLHAGVLRIAKGLKEAQTLGLELQDFRANISESGFTRFGAREGQHDDLVLAVAIGRWYAGTMYKRTVSVAELFI